MSETNRPETSWGQLRVMDLSSIKLRVFRVTVPPSFKLRKLWVMAVSLLNFHVCVGCLPSPFMFCGCTKKKGGGMKTDVLKRPAQINQWTVMIMFVDVRRSRVVGGDPRRSQLVLVPCAFDASSWIFATSWFCGICYSHFICIQILRFFLDI